jgi:hypothetical protein
MKDTIEFASRAYLPLKILSMTESSFIPKIAYLSVNPKRIKKTIKRTYTLGKSKIHKKVGVLIKDKNTRKRVLNAQRDIKRHGINDIKQYLRTHGLMKAGSSAPNDIVRKIYESAMLSGEVTNQDKDILLQNFLKEKDE